MVLNRQLQLTSLKIKRTEKLVNLHQLRIRLRSPLRRCNGLVHSLLIAARLCVRGVTRKAVRRAGSSPGRRGDVRSPGAGSPGGGLTVMALRPGNFFTGGRHGRCGIEFLGVLKVDHRILEIVILSIQNTGVPYEEPQN